jgi:hypothetical protein
MHLPRLPSLIDSEIARKVLEEGRKEGRQYNSMDCTHQLVHSFLFIITLTPFLVTTDLIGIISNATTIETN